MGLFDGIADPADWDVVFAIESLTNPQVRNDIGELDLVPKAGRAYFSGRDRSFQKYRDRYFWGSEGR